MLSAEVGELAKQRLFFFGEIGWGLHDKLDDKVAAPSAIDVGNTHTPQSESSPRIRSHRNEQGFGIFERWNLELGTKGGLGEADRLMQQQIVAVANK